MNRPQSADALSGPPAEGSEGDWLAWRAVVAPLPDPNATYEGWVHHKIVFTGHGIAIHAWFLRRRERRLYYMRSREEGWEPEEHAPLVIYLPVLHIPVCLTCPWAAPGARSRSSAIAQAVEHQQRHATPDGPVGQ